MSNRRLYVTLRTAYRDHREPTTGEYCAQAESRAGAISQVINDRLGCDDEDEIAGVTVLGVVERDGVYSGGAA